MKRILPILLICLSVSPVAVKAATYERDYVGNMKTIRADYEDTFVKIARINNLGYVEMRAANPALDPWIPGENAEIILPTRHLLPDTPRKGITVNLPEMRLYYYPEDGSAPVTHPLGVGRQGLSTPKGTTKIVRKKDGPSWRPTARMKNEDPSLPDVVPPGPENPLGTHALYLGWPEYLIHGTNKPYGIGRRVSSGCIRMYPEDIKKVFGQVPVGTTVHVVEQPVKAGWVGNEFYIEAHPTTEESDILETDGEVENSTMSEEDVIEIVDKAGPIAEQLDWASIRRAVKERRGYPVLIGTRQSDGQPQEASADAPFRRDRNVLNP